MSDIFLVVRALKEVISEPHWYDVDCVDEGYRAALRLEEAEKQKYQTSPEQLHLDAAAYATNRKVSYDEAVKEGIAKKRTPEQMQGIWLAHYEGYREGYWVATGNEFTTNPAKLKEKNGG